MRRRGNAKSGENSSLTVQQGVLMAAVFLLCAATIQAAQPGWWTAPGGPVNSGHPAQDYAVVNQGQLKQFTQKAVLYLDTNLPDGAGPTLDGLVAGWSNYYATNGYTSTNPAPGDLRVVNHGQLKYIASLVYGQFSAEGYTGLYPSWLVANTNAEYKVANQAQLKTVFNFDLSVAPTAVTNLIVSPVNSGEIDLSWTPPPVNNANSLVIEESTDGGATWLAIGSLDVTSTNYAVTDLSADQTYSFRVGLSNTAGSISSTSTPSTNPIPLSPPDLAGTMDTNGYMNLSWPAVIGAASYKVEREALDGGRIWSLLASASGNSYSDTSRALQTGYHYRVSAVDSSGTSTASATFPQPQYAIIDLSVGGTPNFLNNLGSVVVGSTFWKAGVSTSIPLDTVVGLDNNDRVAGSLFGINTIPSSPTIDPTTTLTSVGATWSPGDGSATYLESPHALAMTAPDDIYGSIGSATSIDNANFSYRATAMSDTMVAGSATLSTFYYDPGNFPYDSAPYYFMPTISVGDGGVLWDSTAQLVQTFTREAWSPYIEYNIDAEHDIFTPSGINNSGVMIGKDEHFDNDTIPGATETDGYAISTSGSLTMLPTNFVPTGINNAGTVVGCDSSTPPQSGFINGSSQILPHPAVAINNAGPNGQILDNAGWLWSYNSTNSLYEPRNVADYISDASPSSSIIIASTPGAHPFNDNGEVAGQSTTSSAAVMLVPMQVVSDLNGDGTIDDKDMGLESAALNSTASPENDAKKDGTEYLFPDDTISHGIWSKNDSNAPSGTTDDDNAKQIKITCGATFGSVWFEYNGTSTGSLAFYTSRACTTKVNFPTTSLNGTTTILYVRTEGTISGETDSNLVMKLGTADKSQTFCQTSMPLDIVSGFGDAHFFQAADRYILQNNSRHYVGVKTYPSSPDPQPIDIVVRREEDSTIKVVDAYHHSPVLDGIGQVASSYPIVDQIINGALCGTPTLLPPYIATVSNGQLVSSGTLTPSSTLSGTYTGGAYGRYIAMDTSTPPQFKFGVVGTGFATPSGYQEAIGGLGTTSPGHIYPGSSYPSPYNMTMIGEASVNKTHRVLFTLTYQATDKSEANVSLNMVSDATHSGCLPLPGSGYSGEISLFWNDGGTAIALALKDPDSSDTAPAVTLVEGFRHKYGLPFNVNNYLILDSKKHKP